MSILDDLAADVSAALSGVLRVGSLRRVLPGEDDGYGNQLPGEVVTYPFEGVKGNFGIITAGLGGLPRSAGKIEILASSLAVDPERADKLTIDGEWWLVREVSRDPARAWWTLECELTQPPT
jgi:hypothetical protein